MCDVTKAMLRGKFITLDTYIRKEESSQINDLNINLRKVEKENKLKCEINGRKEMIKIRNKKKKKTKYREKFIK